MFLLSVSLNTFPAEINVGKLHKAKWIEVSSENFLVVTDASEEQAQAMAKELEQFRHFLALLLGYKQRALMGKVPVILAKNRTMASALGMPSNYAGFFARQDTRIVIFANSKGFHSSSDGRTSQGRQVVLHELTHLLMNNASIGLANPLWYSEGVAEYFGSYAEKKGQVILGDMTLLQHRFYSLQRPGGGYESMDTESLFKATEVGIPIDSNRKKEIEAENFYARSLAVVHYLNADPERRKKMYQYLLVINKGFSVDDAFKGVFQMTFAELDKQLREYISSKYVYGRVFDIGKGGVEYPEFVFATRKLEQREAMNFLIPRIAMLRSSALLGAENVDAMYQEVEKLYPDFIQKKENGETSQ
jgi:hypothetical protein